MIRAEVRHSRSTAVAVNLAKLTLLAALAPPVITGIAQRAATLGDGVQVATIVTTAVSAGSIAAIVGALGFGALSDLRSGSLPARWFWVLGATAIGTAGLALLATSGGRSALTIGWVLAQFGYSGAMAVLRVILATTLPVHRRRSAVIMVLGSYGGLAIPLAVLLVFPRAIWETTFGLAVLSLVVPLFVLAMSARGQAHGHAPPPKPSRTITTGENARPRLLPWGLLLGIQCSANGVVTVFLSYHPLELAERNPSGAEFPVQAAVLVVAAAVLGLLITTSALIRWPALLGDAMTIIVFAGFLFAASLLARALTESFSMVTVAAVLTGAAVGLNSSALFASALEAVRSRPGGKLMGAYSAAGAIGQFVGPMLALGVLHLLVPDNPSPHSPAYRELFLGLAAVPALWAIVAWVILRRTRQAATSPEVPAARIGSRGSPAQGTE